MRTGSARLQRLIDRELLISQMNDTNYLAPSRDDVRAGLSKMRKQIPAAASQQGWQDLLASYGLTERDLEAELAQRKADDELRGSAVAAHCAHAAGRG